MVPRHLPMGELMNALRSIGLAVMSLVATGTALAQSGHMRDGDRWGYGWMGGHGGYGGYWVPVLVLAVVVGLVVWVVKQKPKK